MPSFNEFLKSTKKLGKDVFILSAGILIAQLIPLILQPFLKRTFSPEDFGTYDVFLKFFSIFVALSSFKYENAILIPKKDTESKHVLYLCLIIIVVVFLILLTFVLFLHDSIIEQLEGFSLLALILLPVSVLCYSIFNVFNIYLIRRQKFLLSSSSKISRRFSEGLIQVLFGYLKNSNGLLIGDVVGNIIQGAFSFWKVKLITPLRYISKSKLKKVMYEYRELPIFTLIPNILNTFVLGSLTFLVLSKFSLQEVGYLEFTQKILSIPAIFISVAISQVVFQRVSQKIIRNEKILPLVLTVISILVFLSILFIVLFRFFGNEIFVLIGGKDWNNSGDYAKILVYASAAMLIFSPLGKVLIALKRFKINSIWEIAKFAAILLLFYIESTSISEYLIVYTQIIVFFYFIYGGLIIYYSHKYQIEIKNKT